MASPTTPTIVFSIGGGFAIWEAIRTFLHPTPPESYAWGYGVLAGAFVFESASLGVGLRSFTHAKGRRPLRTYLRDLRDPTVLVVVMEDSAALVSIAIAATGMALSQRTGNPLWDGVASGLIGVLLVGVAVVLAFDNYSLLIGEAAAPATRDRIRDIVAAERAAVALASLRTLHIGPQSLFIALRVRFREDLTTRDIEAAVARLKRAISAALGDVTRPELIVIEPAGADAAA